MTGKIITKNLETNLQAALKGDRLINPSDFANEFDISRSKNSSFKHNDSNNAFLGAAQVSQGPGMAKQAAGGIVYTQPQFFSPIHTPINWQIPVKRKEQYQWSRYYYENEPKVAKAIEFYSKFPINGFSNECHNLYVKRYFDKLVKKLNLLKWLRIISHEVHLLGDCFPFLEVECQKCGGGGVTPEGMICEHEGGSFRRLVVLNPECVEVYSDPISPESLIAFLPNDELRTLIAKRGPGYQNFSPEIVKMIAAGAPIPLDNRNVSHLKFSDNGYNKYGVGMVRRLFPILAYKTKLMTAQWIIAERLILPIKVAKVGSDERPASAGDLTDINAKLAQVANDPNLTLVTHHAFELDWFGACHSDDTEVLTSRGWVKFSNCSSDNLDDPSFQAATFKMDTGKIEFQRPLAFQQFDFDGEMVSFKGHHIDALVTPNHDMVVSRRQWNDTTRCYNYGQWEKIRADQVVENTRFRTITELEKSASNDIPYKEIPNSYCTIKEHNISRVAYKGKVYCFTVPNGTLITRRNGLIGLHGNSGKVMQLTNEFEIISQEILDGLGVNKVLLNGEGPTYSSAAIGVEVMIDNLDSWRNELSSWVEEKIYLPIAKMKGFTEVNEWGETEYVYPTIKWDIMHLRDQQQYRTFILQLHEKGAVSTQTMLKAFDIDHDQEVELLRFERIKNSLSGGAETGQEGGMGGGFGGAPDLGALGLGGGGGAPDAGGPPMDMGGMDAMASSEKVNIQNFGGKVLKKKSRDKITKYKERIEHDQYHSEQPDDQSGYLRDEKGRIQFTKPERDLLKELLESVKKGDIRYRLVAQLPVQAMGSEYLIDFAMPDIKLGIEVDGALFHSTPEQIKSDEKRDEKLAQMGWTIIRFTDKEVEVKPRQVVETIIENQIKKEQFLKK